MSSSTISPIKAPIPAYSLQRVTDNANSEIEVERMCGNVNMILEEFLAPHRKDYYFYAFVQEGSSRHWVDGVPYTLKPDTLFFTIPSQVHLKEEPKPITGYILGFTESFLSLEENQSIKQLPIIRNQAAGHELDLQPNEARYIETHLAEMFAEFKSENNWKNQMLTAQLRTLMIYLSRLYTQQFGDTTATGARQLLLRFLDLVNQYHITHHEVADYASKLNITPGYLGDTIKDISGRTALSHIHERIAVEAKRLLLHTDLAVKEITDELGFQDAAYFNRFFKRMTDSTPAAYRETIRKMYS